MIKDISYLKENILVFDKHRCYKGFAKNVTYVVSPFDFNLLIGFIYRNKFYTFEYDDSFFGKNSITYYLNKSETNTGIKLIKLL